MFLGITPVSSVSNGLYFLTVPLVSTMRVICTSKGMSKKFGVRVIYRKIRYLVFLLTMGEERRKGMLVCVVITLFGDAPSLLLRPVLCVVVTLFGDTPSLLLRP